MRVQHQVRNYTFVKNGSRGALAHAFMAIDLLLRSLEYEISSKPDPGERWYRPLCIQTATVLLVAKAGERQGRMGPLDADRYDSFAMYLFPHGTVLLQHGVGIRL